MVKVAAHRQQMSVEDVLSEVSPTLPRFVEDVFFEPTIDASGNDAVYVWLVMPDRHRVTPAQFENLLGASRRIEDAFAKSGLSIVPYIRYVRHSDMQRRDEENDNHR